MKLEITIDGDDASDIETALNEVQRLVADGYLAGSDSNDTGSFQFKITDIE